MAKHSPHSSSLYRTTSRAFKPTRLQTAVVLCLLASAHAWAQTVPTEITITDKLPSRVSGFGDVSSQELPMSTSTFTSTQLREMGAQRVSDALRLDAAVSDSYNSPAYWDMLSVRGFTLDNRYNYRREGFPISAETMIALDNKERIELLKGTSGIQAGTSAPGGLVNYVVKRAPTQADQTIRNVSASLSSANSRLVAADVGGRFGAQAQAGYRFNVAYEDINPYVNNANGHRHLVSLAMDVRVKPGTVIDFEIEQSQRQQIGVNGYSLLGGKLPAPVDPSRNLTYQNWSLPGNFEAFTGTLRLRQELDNGWRWTTQYGAQRLKTDDRLTFGYGCSSNNDYSQYCANGSFDLYDFRSENERRISDALQTQIQGQAVLAGLRHDLSFGVLRQRQLDRLPPKQAFAFINSSGSVYTPFTSAPNPDISTTNSNRSEYSTELSAKDRVQLSNTTSVWAGLRHVMFNRSSVRNDATNPNASQFAGHINAPWIGVSQKINQLTAYLSLGHGVETFVVPNNLSTYYANGGQQLGIGRSRQTELGLRSPDFVPGASWNAALFEITRPLVYDDGIGSKLLDGKQTHTGIELGLAWRSAQWQFGTQTQWLHARISDVQKTTNAVGNTPLNVPSFTLRGMAQYRFSSLPGLRSGVSVSHEGKREVLENGTLQLPAWSTWGAITHYDTKVNQVASTWTLAIDNLTDKRYWRESPKQFGHYYLYAGAPRSVRATVQFKL
jgi:iron complex outermembrane recepter protein